MADTLIREVTAFQSNPLSPVPQYWAGAGYEKIQGANGAGRVLLYDAAGAVLLTSGNAGYIQAVDGGLVSLGLKADAAVQDASSAATAISLLKGIQAILGLVTASPTANTVNARLKNIEGYTDGIEASLTILLAQTDGIETTLGTLGTQTTLAAIDTKLGVVGAQANAWNAAVVGIAGDSVAIDCQHQSNISAFGNVSAATTITIYVSQDNVTYYATATNVVLGGPGDFHFSFQSAARYVRLRSSAAATITATIAGK